MLKNIKLENLVVIDIETVPMEPSVSLLSPELRKLYMEKSKRLVSEEETEEEKFFNHAGIFAEFGKIICIGVGYFQKEKVSKALKFRVKAFSGHDEDKLLLEFFALLRKHFGREGRFLFAGHNIREFDVPYICRRALLLGLELPAMLDIAGKKSYEIIYADTMQLWRFGDYKHYTSLKLLTTIFHIDSPKDDIDGKDVGRIYWKENDLERIATYCRKDVIAVAQLLRRFKQEPLLLPSEIVHVK